MSGRSKGSVDREGANLSERFRSASKTLKGSFRRGEKGVLLFWLLSDADTKYPVLDEMVIREYRDSGEDPESFFRSLEVERRRMEKRPEAGTTLSLVLRPAGTGVVPTRKNFLSTH